MNVKTVDFKSPSAPKEFTHSLKDTGFAILKNHPISPELIENTFSEWKTFFSSQEKFNYTFDPAKQAGFFPFRSENAKGAKQKDLKEFYHYYPWGELPTAAKKHTQEMYRRMSELGATLLSWIEENTPSDVRAQFSTSLSEMVAKSPETLLRAIHYPPLTGSEEEGAVRAAAHEDINMITLLPAASAPGLQVLDLAQIWHDVPCDIGAIAINSGDMLKEASGGYYPSTTHRVMNPSGPDAKLPRYSMPLFLHARPEIRLSKKHTAKSYLEERLREIGLKANQTN